ncbi:MAG TPA: V-type ATP synthase subunit I [Candidatus Thermoplasmatota archaeon]|nr:V-type ATP synthase subunit I [Candidatus Thermoplasmatota archaeon]
MALKPEPMQRVLVISSRDRERAIIETLYKLRVAHIVDHVEGRDAAFADFRLGRSLPESSKASERLVRIRGMIRALGLEGKKPARASAGRAIDEQLETAVFAAEQDVAGAAESKAKAQAAIDALTEEETRLRPLASLPFDLEDFRGYESLAVFVGATAEPVDAAIRAAAPDAEVFRGEGNLVAVFAPVASRDAVADALFKAGYRETSVPEGAGSIPARLAAIEQERAGLKVRLEQSESRLADLAARHGDFLLAAEEHLAIEVEKAEAPLTFASTEHAFAVDAWVPAEDVGSLKAALDQATSGNVHIVERERAADHHAHGHGPEHLVETHGETAAHEEPPTKLKNAAGANQFQFFTEMFSVPKWNEIDPTIVLALTFPFFYGLMIGDAGYGVLMALVGLLLLKLVKKAGTGGRELGFAFLVSGIVAFSFGFFVFEDAFGIPFDAPHTAVEEMKAHGEALTCAAFQSSHAETTWRCLLTGQFKEGHPYVHKLAEVGDLLIFSVVAAFFHLGVGFLFGVLNEAGHSKKHAIAKASWILVLSGFMILVLSQAGSLAPRVGGFLAALLPAAAFDPLMAGAFIGLGVLGLVVTEGAIALLEVPSLLANMLSYTRLAGVGVAKGAMVAAFNGLTLVAMTLTGGSLVIAVVGIVLFAICQLLVFGLGLLSSGIQAIRLNYVEFFTKFYKGGGKKFSPFGRVREFTTE